MSNISKVTHEGEIQIGDFSIPCYILEDGSRVLSTAGMQRALGLETEAKQRSSGRLEEILTSKAVSRFISGYNDTAKYTPITCYHGKKKISAYSAVILPEICETMLKVRDYANKNKESLGTRQLSVIEHADVLIRALARVGIIALIDEATGYQYERERDELQKVLTKYISQELLPWQKRFPDEYYKEIFRLNNWDFTVSGIKKRPGIVGTWTKNLIYNMLPSGVVKELENKTPKSKAGNKTARLHQSLTVEIGEPHLEKQLISVITLMNVSDNWAEFERLFQKKFGQQELSFPEPIENKLLSSGDVEFDKQVGSALKKGKPKK